MIVVLETVLLLLQTDVDECADNNGDCHEERECINTLGSMRCGDCSAGWRKDGTNNCNGERPDGELGMRS